MSGSAPFTQNLHLLGTWTALDVRVVWAKTADCEAVRDTAVNLDDITFVEYAGSGYPATYNTRYAIGTESKTIDSTDNDQKLTTTEGVLNKTTIGATPDGTVNYYIFYIHNTSDADSLVLGYHDLAAAGESFTPSGGAVNTTWDPEGIGKIIGVLA